MEVTSVQKGGESWCAIVGSRPLERICFLGQVGRWRPECRPRRPQRGNTEGERGRGQFIEKLLKEVGEEREAQMRGFSWSCSGLGDAVLIDRRTSGAIRYYDLKVYREGMGENICSPLSPVLEFFHIYILN